MKGIAEKRDGSKWEAVATKWRRIVMEACEGFRYKIGTQ